MILSNARLILEDEVVEGTLEISDGLIRRVDNGTSRHPDAIDCAGGYLLPGMVELHTDNMEKHFTPRPGVYWPGLPAFKAHDAQMVGAGITTVFDAISVGDVVQGSARLNNLTRMVDALVETKSRALVRADHLLHLRCEVSHDDTLANFEALAARAPVSLVSLMDHSPGQRQFVRLDKYREYYQGKYHLNDAELEEFVIRQKANSERNSRRYRLAISSICQARGIAIASHDDATPEHVAESAELKTSIAEFPTTIEAARGAHQAGMAVMMGAPNVIRGGSHSGNIAAHELASLGVLDVLSSDYYPGSLLDSAFMLSRDERNAINLPEAIAMVTATPARAAGLEDRGRLAEGLRADLIWASEHDDHMHIEHVWKDGVRVF